MKLSRPWPLPVYLCVSNAFAMLRLLPLGDRDKDAEILAVRHQLAVLQRQLRPRLVRFAASDRVYRHGA